MLSTNIDDYLIGSKRIFHDQNQCEVKGEITGKRYRDGCLSLTVLQDDGSYYDAQIPLPDDK